MRILVTGASSYVGASMYAALKENHAVVGTYCAHQLFPELEHLDVTKKAHVLSFVKEKNPEVIVHIAANASGSWCEKNPKLAVAINQDGTAHVVQAANAVHARMIFISSLAVCNKDSVYSQTKIAGEKAVKTVKAGHVILRPSLIVGHSPNTVNDRPFNRFLKNIEEGIPAVYDTSWRFQPTWLRHLDEVLLQVIEQGIVNKTIPVSVPELKTRYDLAKDILPAFGIQVTPEDKKDPTPTFSEDLRALKELRLPQYTYEEMIAGIIQEIRAYLKRRS